MHSPYEDTQNRQPDFIVEYEIVLCDEVKNAKLHQGLKTVFYIMVMILKQMKFT